jgi:glycosyltransferase involved in cell wall biosynthesis
MGAHLPLRTIALVDWTHLIEDFLDNSGISFEEFRNEMRGSWVFGYIDALQRVGVRPVFVGVSARVETTSRFRHEPSGATICLLPAPKAYRATRRRVLNPYALRLESAVGSATGVRRAALGALKEVAPYLATPLVQLARELRYQGCDAILCQEYEHARFDECVLLGRWLRLPVFATFQSGDHQLSRLEAPIRPLALRACTGVIIATSREVERVRRRYRLPPAKIARIFNPVDLSGWSRVDRSQAREALGIPAEAGVAAWHGRVDLYVKGLDLLLEAWERVCAERPGRELRLLMVGAGHDADALRRRIAALTQPNVVWVDQFIHDRELLRRYLSAADVYVLSSRHEGFPLAPIEAMSCGLPVVASDAPGMSDILEGGDSGGVVVPLHDAAALGRAVGVLLDDEALRRRLSERARLRAETAFSPEAIGRQLRAFLFCSPADRLDADAAPRFEAASNGAFEERGAD